MNEFRLISFMRRFVFKFMGLSITAYLCCFLSLPADKVKIRTFLCYCTSSCPHEYRFDCLKANMCLVKINLHLQLHIGGRDGAPSDAYLYATKTSLDKRKVSETMLQVCKDLSANVGCFRTKILEHLAIPEMQDFQLQVTSYFSVIK